MDYIECLHKLSLDPDNMLIQDINELTKVLLLVPHLNIQINPLQDW